MAKDWRLRPLVLGFWQGASMPLLRISRRYMLATDLEAFAPQQSAKHAAAGERVFRQVITTLANVVVRFKNATGWTVAPTIAKPRRLVDVAHGDSRTAKDVGRSAV